jgi:hypothetical protein
MQQGLEQRDKGSSNDRELSDIVSLVINVFGESLAQVWEMNNERLALVSTGEPPEALRCARFRRWDGARA